LGSLQDATLAEVPVDEATPADASSHEVAAEADASEAATGNDTPALEAT
jgi:hypothetical protein